MHLGSRAIDTLKDVTKVDQTQHHRRSSTRSHPFDNTQSSSAILLSAHDFIDAKQPIRVRGA